MKTFVRLFILGMLAAPILFSGCASKRYAQQLEETQHNLQQAMARADTLAIQNQRLAEESRNVNAWYNQALHEMEQLKTANRSLYAVNQDLNQRFEKMLTSKEDYLSASSHEKMTLQQELSASQLELDQKEGYLRNLEWELAQKEERLRLIQEQAGLPVESVQPPAGGLPAQPGNTAGATTTPYDRQIQELQAQLQQKDMLLRQMREKISHAMYGFPASEYSLKEKKGKLYVSMSQELLFPSGSARLDQKGKNALKQLASALKDNPDIEITVEGHTDTQGTAAKNWELSTQRALAVVQELVARGVAPQRLSAAGRAFYDPVAPNTTASGRALNRRTEIIVEPRLDELMQLAKP